MCIRRHCRELSCNSVDSTDARCFYDRPRSSPMPTPAHDTVEWKSDNWAYKVEIEFQGKDHGILLHLWQSCRRHRRWSRHVEKQQINNSYSVANRRFYECWRENSWQSVGTTTCFGQTRYPVHDCHSRLLYCLDTCGSRRECRKVSPRIRIRATKKICAHIVESKIWLRCTFRHLRIYKWIEWSL